MKIPPRTIDGFVKAPPANVMAVLIYGPDEGLVRERLNALTAVVVPDIHDPFNIAEISGADLSSAPARLLDEAKSISMLGGRRVVRVIAADDGATGPARDALSALSPGDNFILIAAGGLGPRSTLRLLFENADNAAALPCYVDDARDISRVLADDLRARGLSIAPDALSLLSGQVLGDRAMARSELEKLVLYVGDGQKTITLEDVTACIGDSAELSLDDLARLTVSGQFAPAARILEYLLAEGTTPVLVLRNLQNYFLRLQVTKARLQKGEGLDSALAKLRPPLFFKTKPAFESQVHSWSLAQIEQAISLLAGAEARSKQGAVDGETFVRRAVLGLSQMATRIVRTAA